MYLMYVDESGDPGLLPSSPTRFFVLSGLVIHELKWKDLYEELLGFRRFLKVHFGFKLREEFHSAALITRPGKFRRIEKHNRLAMIRLFADKLNSLPYLSLINVVVDKTNKTQGYDVFTKAWEALIQRFENTIQYENFPPPKNLAERGLIFCDHTDDKKLTALLRMKHAWNPVPSRSEWVWSGGYPTYRDLPLEYLIEDPNFKDSSFSYFVQAADLCAFLLYQHEAPSSYMKRNAGNNYFHRLERIFCTKASPRNEHGIVRL